MTDVWMVTNILSRFMPYSCESGRNASCWSCFGWKGHWLLLLLYRHFLWDFHATFVRVHEFRACMSIWKDDAQWSYERKRHSSRFITPLREYLPCWKIWLEDFPLVISATPNLMWITAAEKYAFLNRNFSTCTSSLNQRVYKQKIE